jgi:hypothetical protein
MIFSVSNESLLFKKFQNYLCLSEIIVEDPVVTVEGKLKSLDL